MILVKWFGYPRGANFMISLILTFYLYGDLKRYTNVFRVKLQIVMDLTDQNTPILKPFKII
jgi:hypothetical protein